jgi:hypothetical protein
MSIPCYCFTRNENTSKIYEAIAELNSEPAPMPKQIRHQMLLVINAVRAEYARL